MNKILLLLSLTVITIFISCDTEHGSGNIISVQKSVPEFNAVSVSGGITAELRNGPQKVVIEADDNLMEYVKAEVENGRLKISTGNKSIRDADIRVFITAPSIRRVSGSAGAEISIKDELRSANRIHLESSSAAEIDGRVDAPGVELSASSGSELKVNGRTRNLKIDASSGSEIEAFGLMAESSDVSASSGAKVEVHASVALNAEASSGAGIKFRNGGEVSIKQSSGGTVSKAN